MATLGKPSITTPSKLEQRGYQQAIDNIKERFTALEAEVRSLRALIGGNKDFAAIKLLQQQVAALTRAVTALDTSKSISVVNALLAQPDGLVVLKGDTLITRVLQAGEGIVILYPDGTVSDPLIKLGPALGGSGRLAGGDDWLWGDDALDGGFE